ncbi:MAG: hypothetical protein ACRDGM_06895 [bacterium]
MKIITIMPDFGMGSYAWQKDDSDNTTWVGANIADAVGGFEHAGYKVSKSLEADFAVWVTWFERGALGDDALTMDCKRFHRQGSPSRGASRPSWATRCSNQHSLAGRRRGWLFSGC